MSSNVNRHSERFMSSFDQLVLALKPIVWASLWLLGVLWLSRLGLAIWQWERISQTDAWLLLCLAALRFDGVLLGMVWAIPLTVLPLSLLQQRVRAAWARVI